MKQEKYFVTKEGYEQLKQRLEYLIKVERVEILDAVKEARSHGDVSENADLDAANARNAQIAKEISELEKTIQNAQIISEAKDTKYVRLGSSVIIREIDTNDEYEYKIVGSVDADPLNGMISNVSPLAEAILDKKVNSVVEVKVDKPYKVKILSVH